MPLFSTRATAVVSVSLVLFLLGLAALVGIATHRLSRNVMENVGFVVVFDEDVTTETIARITDGLRRADAVSATIYSTPEQILDRWQKLIGEEEDILSLAGVNPFTPELEVHVKPEYASADSIAVLSAPIVLMPEVSEVKVHNDLIDNVGSLLHSVTMTLIGVAAALLIVSFVLIFNTVRLTVYSRRFLINTMQLVGATPGFIRRPFLTESLLNGAVAGMIGGMLLTLTVTGTVRFESSIASMVDWDHVLGVILAMVVTGVVICLVASAMACNRYLSLNYDQLHRQ
ncbi:MAG: permease-like cell division protein FtsX [Duncaniella sp.]|nr:permease-like cell division protein FtsX [Duncaniella sp.]